MRNAGISDKQVYNYAMGYFPFPFAFNNAEEKGRGGVGVQVHNALRCEAKVLMDFITF